MFIKIIQLIYIYRNMTAEELMLQRLYVTNDGEPASIHDNFNTVKDTMVEFAKYHVQKALELASQEGESYVIGGMVSEIDKDSIINAYPFENIK